MNHLPCSRCGADVVAGSSCAVCRARSEFAATADLDRRIDERARQILAEAKAAETRAALASATEARRSELVATVELASRALEARRAREAKRGGTLAQAAKIYASALAFVALVVLAARGFQVAEWTPAYVGCPLVCDGCASSGNYVTWQVRTIIDGQSGGDMFYQLLCANPHVDVTRVTYRDLAVPRADLLPFMMPHWEILMWELIVYCAVFVPLLGTFAVLRFHRKMPWRVRVEMERRRFLEEAVDQALVELKQIDGAADQVMGPVPYR